MKRDGTTGHESWMSLALEAAAEALDQGEFPVGCVIVGDQEVVATGARFGTIGREGVFSEVDHAEIRALRQLAAHGRSGKGLTLYCTMEPCLMCFAAAVLAGIHTVVYAYEDVMGGGTGCDLTRLAPLYRRSAISVVPGVMRSQSLELFYRFFSREGNPYWCDSLLERYTLEQWENGIGTGRQQKKSCGNNS